MESSEGGYIVRDRSAAFLKRISWHPSIQEIMLAVYVIGILMAQVILGNTSKRDLLSPLYLIVFASLVICPIVLKWAKGLTIGTDQSRTKMETALYFLVPLAVLLVYYAASYPGYFPSDSVDQYQQAVNGTYNDWHPAMQTILTFTLPLTLTGGWVGSIILFQIVLFTCAVGYALVTIRLYTNRRFAVLAMLYIVLNPQTGAFVMHPWKDMTFAIGALLLVSFAIRIFMTKGEWLRSVGSMALFSLILALTTLVRHNAVLFTAPLMIAILVYARRRQAVIVCIASLILFSIVKFPVYSLLDVEAPGKRKVELLGLPMTVIGAVVQNTPERLDPETREFAYAVAPPEVWEEKYVYGSYNQVKWDKRTNNHVIEEYGVVNVLRMMAKSVKASPGNALRGLIALTDPVYSITNIQDPVNIPGTGRRLPGTEEDGIPALKTVLRRCAKLCVYLPHLLGCLGALHLALLVLVLAKCGRGALSPWVTVLFILPVFCYNFGTALLLTGFADAARFFYYTFLLFPSLLVFLLRGGTAENKDEIGS